MSTNFPLPLRWRHTWPHPLRPAPPLTVAKRRPVSGVSVVAEAGVLGSVQGLACCELVATVANVRGRARIHQTGEPCCVAETQAGG